MEFAGFVSRERKFQERVEKELAPLRASFERLRERVELLEKQSGEILGLFVQLEAMLTRMRDEFSGPRGAKSYEQKMLEERDKINSFIDSDV